MDNQSDNYTDVVNKDLLPQHAQDALKLSALRKSFKVGHVYVLVRDVTNPKPDRRQRYDWTAQVNWLAGTRFTISRKHIIDDIYRNAITTGRWGNDYFFLEKAPRELLAALVEVEPTVDESLDAYDLKGYKDEAINLLVKNGTITLQQLIDAALAVADEQEAD